MKVYRDCINGVPPLDGFPDASGNVTPAYFTIFDASGSVIVFSQFTALTYSTVPPSNNSPCAPSTNGVACVQEGLYEASVNLPPKTGGYYIVYQRCCRNQTILNLVNPQDVGATYWEFIPGPEVVAVNNSPRFNKRPPIYICANIPIAFDHSATDPDGDSLVYSLCTPFNGLDACCPIINTSPPVSSTSQCPVVPSGCPTNNTPPPYISVPFLAPYSSSYPMASNPAININPVTGLLNGNPTMLGQWVVGVCVSEYRNGQLIAVHHRDFQFNVINCPYVVTADIIAQTTTNNGQGTGYCNGFDISYHNNSYNGTTYHWDFGDPNSTSDTSNAYNPNHTYNTPGDYTVTLIVNPGPCSDTAQQVFHIHPLLAPQVAHQQPQCLIGNHFTFNGAGSYQGNGSFSWVFGPNATPQSANTPTVNNVSFNAPGTYTVSFTVNENGCSAFAIDTVTLYQNPVASIGNFTVSGCDPLTVTFPNLSTGGAGMNYLWQFSDGTTSTAQFPTHTFSPAGVYSVSLTVITNQQCIDTSLVSAVNSITVATKVPVSLNYTSLTGECFNGNLFNFNGQANFQNSGTISWLFTPNMNPSTYSSYSVSDISFPQPGTYTVTFSAEEEGCVNSITQLINLYPNTVASIKTYPDLGCDPMVINFQNTSSAGSLIDFLWTFSDGTQSTLTNPTHTFTPPGVYTFTLSAATHQNCIDSSAIVSVNSITVNPSPIASFSATPLTTSIFDPTIYFFNLSSPDVTTWNYNFDDGTSSAEVNPSHHYSTWGNFDVILTVTNQYDCKDTALIRIVVTPEFRFWIPNCFTPGNHDDLNDVFKPIVFGVEDYNFMIFDRWGAMIYQTHDTDAGWDGTYKGKPCQQDVYVWKCTFTNVVSKQPEDHVGHVTLLK